MISLILVLVGVFLLYLGGEFLVKGSTGLSLRFGLSPLIVGLTVVAFGTSAPELFVGVGAALAGKGDIAFGNVVGSNIANVLLILGVPAIIAYIATDKCEAGVAWFQMMIATLVFIPLVLITPFGWKQSLVLLTLFIVVLSMQIWRARKDETASVSEDVDLEAGNLPLSKIVIFILIGIVCLPLGAELLVRGASDIARYFRVPEAVIGLTIVAIGTSLPELATSVSAAFKGKTDLAIGNVLGSNLFNLLLIIGATGLFANIHVNSDLIKIDVPIMTAVSLLLGVFIIGKIRITRTIGFFFVGAYFIYILRFIV